MNALRILFSSCTFSVFVCERKLFVMAYIKSEVKTETKYTLTTVISYMVVRTIFCLNVVAAKVTFK